MKKIILSLLAAISFLTVKTVNSQTWVEKMQDPAVNFYDVQKSFNEYFSGSKLKALRREQQHERKEMNDQRKKEEKALRSGVPLKAAFQGSKREDRAEVPNFELYKRWEDYMRVRLYPSGDRSVMTRAMNEYFDNYSSSQLQSTSSRASQAAQAASWSIIGPTTTIPSGGGAGRVNFVRFDPTNTNTIFVGSPSGGLWKSTTGGTGWTSSTDNLAVIGCTDLAINPSNTQIMYLATGDGEAQDTYSTGVLKTTDGGTTWTASGLNWTVLNGRSISKLLLNPVNPKTIFAAGSSGIYRSINSGGSWTQVSTVTNIKDIEYRPGDTTVVYACSNTRFYKSTNGGTSYTNITSGLPAATASSRLAIGVSANDPTCVYVLAAIAGTGSANDYGFEGLYRSLDNGTTFTTRATSPNLLGFNSNGGDQGGQGWYTLSIAVSPINKDLVLVGGVNIWKSIDGGVNWTLNAHWTGSGAPYVHADIHALEFIPGSSTTYFAGCDGGCFQTANTGGAWSDLSNGLQISQAYRIGCSATSSSLLITGLQDNGTIKNSGTTSWTSIQGGDGMEAIIDWSNANVQYGELYYGQINRTTTGGNLGTSIVSSGGTGVNADGDWVTPYIMNPKKASTLIVGKAQAYRSVNRGGAWSAMGAITGGTGNLTALAYAPSDSNYIYMAKTDRFYVSTNNGTSFTDRTSGLPVTSAAITYIAAASNNAAHVWVTFSGYSSANKVFYSADAGVTWTNYTTGLPNLPVNCIVYQNASTNDALYAGTDVGVYYRDNTAGSWAAYNTGLPNVVVKELEIQYSASKLRAATFGRGIWQSNLMVPGTSPPIADFTASKTSLCSGECINFTDLSNGAPTSWSWSFPGASTTSSTAQNPTNICYSTAGTYDVSLTATNANGSNTMTKTGYITVTAAGSLPFVENFEAAAFPPAGWSVLNADAPSIVWGTAGAKGLERRAALGNTGSTSGCAGIEFYNYSTDTTQVDYLISKPVSLAGAVSPRMTFKRAYKYYNDATSPNNYHDELRIYISSDCGLTFGPSVYYKKGVKLATNGTLNTSFTPGVTADWDVDTLDLTAFIGTNIIVKFETTNRYGNCLYLDDVNINSTAAPAASVTISSNDADNIICAGTAVTFTAVATNGGTAPAYQWQVNGVNAGTNSAVFTTSALTNGQIVTCIMISNLAGVTGSPATSNAITMTVNAIPAAPAAGSNTPVCAGAAINLTASAITGASYSWTGPSSFASTTQNPSRAAATAAMAGTYSVTAAVSGCVSAAGTTSVVVNALPAAPTAGSNTPVCAGAAINLTASAITGASYSWTGPNTFTSTSQNPSIAAATAAMAGTYSVTATVSGCASAAGTTSVVVNALPVVTVNSPTICPSTTASLTASGAATYAWSAGATSTGVNTASAAPAATTTYTVTGTTSGCIGTAVSTVTVASSLVITVNSPTICAGQSASLTASGASTYSWNTGSTANPLSVSPAATTSYTVTGTSSSCTGTAVATVTVNQPPVSNAGSDIAFCSGASGSIGAASSAGYTYLWSPTAGLSSSTAANPSITLSNTTASPVTTIYAVSTTANGCSSIDAVNVTVNPTATVIVPANNTYCSGAAVAASSFSSNIAGATFSWTNSNTAIGLPASGTGNISSYTALNATANAITATISVTPTANGCAGISSSFTVTVNPIPAAPTITQSGTTLTSSAAAGNQWYLNAAAIPGANGQTYTYTANGDYTVVVTAGGCSSASSTAVTVTNVGIKEVTADPFGLLVYPNPNEGDFIVSFVSPERSTYKIEVFNALGQIVLKDEMKDFTGTYAKHMNVIEYGRGVYTISVTNSKNETIKKIIVY